ncbi:MAG: hypothetical protein EOO46_06730 [Flavobacterium sp.]|nr:MAG: hypothetical protein EOO46_06730 [Flavobacterium sp.]
MKTRFFSNLIIATSALLAFIVFGCGNGKKETIDLKLDLKPGEVFKIYTATLSNGDQMKYQNIMKMNFTLDSVTKDKNVIAVKVLRISSESDMFGEKESYDSNKSLTTMTEDERSMHLDFQDILNGSFSIVINNKGKVLEPFKNKETKQPSEEIIDISNIFIPFPEEAVSVGSEWKSERTNSLTNAKNLYTYKITEINEKEIIVSVAIEIGAVKGIMSKNTAEGNYVLDKKTCKLIAGEYSMDLQMGGGKATYKFNAE